MVRTMQVASGNEEKSLIERTGALGELNQESKAFHWLRCDHFLLDKFLPGNKKESLSFLLGFAILVRHDSSLFWSPYIILSEVSFCLLNLFNSSGLLFYKSSMNFYQEYSHNYFTFIFIMSCKWPQSTLVAQLVMNPPAMETPVQFLCLEDLLEKG